MTGARSETTVKLCRPVQKVKYVIEFKCARWPAWSSSTISANQNLICIFDMANAPKSQICLRGAQLSLVRLNADDMFRRLDATTASVIPSPFV